MDHLTLYPNSDHHQIITSLWLKNPQVNSLILLKQIDRCTRHCTALQVLIQYWYVLGTTYGSASNSFCHKAWQMSHKIVIVNSNGCLKIGYTIKIAILKVYTHNLFILRWKGCPYFQTDLTWLMFKWDSQMGQPQSPCYTITLLGFEKFTGATSALSPAKSTAW